MKLIALAAALAVAAGAAAAQDTPTTPQETPATPETTPATPPTPDSTMPDTTAPSTPPAAPAEPQTMPQTTGAGEVASGEDPKGGYMPSTPPLSGTPQPGQAVRFVPNAQSPTEAFPPPAPLAKYPVCKRGQFDNCRQRGG